MSETLVTKERPPQPIFRKDYSPPDYWIDAVELDFELGEEETLVRAVLELRRNPDAAEDGGEPPLVLHGEELELRRLALDGRELQPGEYELGDEQLSVHGVPASFRLETLVAIRPQDNTALSGLYRSGGMFCTQCEAEGFRRITWFLDRPDVMARYTTTIRAARDGYPVLLSNGNRIDGGELEDGRHWARWEDPFPKPSYLFALVAGDLRCHRGSFTTRSGREVALEIWVEPANVDRCEHALRSLQRAMKWDEDTFGLEYDLDTYMIVAVSDFNMGAMENKGLNIFNAKLVLALPETATDDDYEHIEGVIGHEYFHNWTGNRVTCRDWFQLTLKEGLTVFRDQQFTADMTSRAVKRIDDVSALREAQLPEDSGPMAHPIRPESYIEMNNFYTRTVYEKGAEVVRMYHTLLGAEGFRRGIDLYFERHDGQAVTCEDFRAAMADANGVDLGRFERWYSQAGTPVLAVEGSYDERAGSYTLRLYQSRPDLDGQPAYRPTHVPVAVGLLGADGRDLPLQLAGEAGPSPGGTRVLELLESEQSFTFTGLAERPVPSVLRGYSAPVQLELERTREERAFLMAHDSDSFNRWDAGQELAREVLLGLAADAAAGRELRLDPLFVEAFGRLLGDASLDASLKALALQLPGLGLLSQYVLPVDVEALHAARVFAYRGLAAAHRGELLAAYEAGRARGPYRADRESIARRRLKNVALAYLGFLQEPELIALAHRQFEAADNMTDAQAALACLNHVDAPERGSALAAFYERWKHDPLVLDKWFGVQATSTLPGTTARVVELSRHPDFTFKNPNRVYALVRTYGRLNLLHFHDADGAGYAFLGDAVLELDGLNPSVASRVVSCFNLWKRFDPARQALMRAQLERIVARPGLSKDVYEIASKALA